MLAVLDQIAATRTFTRNRIAPADIWLALGENTSGQVRLEDCDIDLAHPASAIKLVSTSTSVVTIDGCTFTGDSTRMPVNAEGGLVRFVGTPVPPGSSATAPGRFEVL
jgi:hypothetical protein